MNMPKRILKLFFIAIACVCIQQPMYSMEDLVDILTTEIMMRPTNYPGSLKAWFKRWIIQNKKNRHISDMKKLGKKDCSARQTRRVHNILEELGVKESDKVPVKRLKKKIAIKEKTDDITRVTGGITTLTGIWLCPNFCSILSQLFEAHEVYHYANKHSQQKKFLSDLQFFYGQTGNLLILIPSYRRYVSKILISFKFPLLCYLTGFFLVYTSSMLVSNTLLNRWHERSACSFSIKWACDRGYDKEVENFIIDTDCSPDDIKQLIKLFLKGKVPSSAYNNYHRQAYKNWKKNQENVKLS